MDINKISPNSPASVAEPHKPKSETAPTQAHTPEAVILGTKPDQIDPEDAQRSAAQVKGKLEALGEKSLSATGSLDSRRVMELLED